MKLAPRADAARSEHGSASAVRLACFGAIPKAQPAHNCDVRLASFGAIPKAQPAHNSDVRLTTPDRSKVFSSADYRLEIARRNSSSMESDECLCPNVHVATADGSTCS